MRFLKVSNYYQQYLDDFFATYPQASALPFEQEMALLMGDRNLWSDAWKRTIETAGLGCGCEVVINHESLQKKWAREHGVKYSSSGWLLEIFEAQVRDFQPDILFSQDFSYIPSGYRTYLRARVPAIRWMIGWDGVARNNPSAYSECDLVLSCVEETADFYRAKGIPSYFLGHAFDPVIHQEIGAGKRTHELGFVGSVYLGPGGHIRRFHFLRVLSMKLPVKCWVTFHESLGDSIRKRIGWRLRRGEVRDLLALRRLHARSFAPRFGKRMFRLLGETLVSLNCHIDSAGKNAANMRLFEATGMGSCLVTDWKPNLGSLFEPDREIVTFSSLEECIEKSSFLLEHPNMAEEIGRRGRMRTMKEHNLSDRILEFFQFFKGWIARNNVK